MFINVLADGLSLADEPLLEGALDDGTAFVRKAAADMLAALPGSALGRRMAGRAVRCVSMERAIGGRRLMIHPPAEPDAAMRRDGITPGPFGHARAASRYGLLTEIAARTPLDTWTREFGLPPERIVAVAAGDWLSMLVPALFSGWSRAAVAQGDQEWMTALISRMLAGRFPSTFPGTATEAGQLARRADPGLGAPGALADPVPEPPAGFRRALEVLRFRYEMLKELDDDHGDG